MIKNLDKDQQQQAVSMGLMMAGAAMMDPRGTNGQFGAALNKGMKAGVGTAIPIMQWMQQTNLEDDDRKYKKMQDRIANRLRQKQQVLKEMQFKADEAYRNKVLDYESKRYGLQAAKFQHEKDLLEKQTDAVSQFARDVSGGYQPPGAPGPRVGYDPKTSMPPRRDMTPQEFQSSLAGLSVAGVPAQTVTALGNMAPNNPSYPGQFNSSAYYANLEALAAAGDKDAQAKLQARTRLDPAMMMMMQLMGNMHGGGAQFDPTKPR